jgi:hypothetical protein
MPNANRGTSMYLGGFSSPDTLNQPLSANPASASAATPAAWYAPGDIGMTFEYQDKAYTVAVLDSGATSANAVGAPAANMLLFWKSRANRIVTNDYRQSTNPAAPGTSVAGVLRVTPTTIGAGGNVIAMLIRGFGIPVKAGTTAVGAVMANTAASTASVVTATGVLQQVGQATTVDSNGVATVNVDIPQLP